MAYLTSWRSRLGCFAVGLIFAISVMLVTGFWVISPPLPLHSFDPVQWRSVTRSDEYSRQDMVGALIWHGYLDGKTKDEVVRMLGPNCECEYFSDWDLVYWLGPERGWLSLDSEWLVIRFDSAGKVAEYTLVTD